MGAGGRPLLSPRRCLTAVCYLAGIGILFLYYGLAENQDVNTHTKSSLYKMSDELLDSSKFELTARESFGYKSRHLLFILPNCTPPAIEQFPQFFTQAQRQRGLVALCVLVGLYTFVGLAIACDDYFLPSLERISDAFKLQPDVAGATFMAAGSSAPELATAVIGVFIAKDDIGLGAVVGSAVFNILFVISVCALFAGAVVYLHWWPLVRDSIVYLLSILALTFIIMDEQIFWYESLCMLGLYVFYIILMIFNPSIEHAVTSRMTFCPQPHDVRHKLDDTTSLNEKQLNGHSMAMTAASPPETDSEESNLEYEDRQTLLPSSVQMVVKDHYPRHQQRSLADNTPVKKEEEESDKRLVPPDSVGWLLLWVLSLPLILLMYVTVPDTRRSRWRRWYVVTFVMSCVWISAFSYVMVWMITVTGHTFHIPDTVMGLTLIAAGVSVPDAIASLMVARDGEGDMAVSNAIGSNVFDILVCLGLPWSLKTCITEPNSSIRVYSAGLIYASITLFSTVFFLIIATWLNGWKLNRKYGVILMIAYLIVTVLTTLYELNIFGFVHPAECPTRF